ncbi:hypothetical protein [Pseudomonas sp. COW5]|uniref:hypothetical protein n=1 Tax=Pseudomonas sp. COW5 TaxID=2981253 RepID=UPI0022454AE4|nr:hypothetical protein [Pseudomonas sp. COW5]MCX2546107.1 hypothetical protein [Pseudomonas sp. COW5]
MKQRAADEIEKSSVVWCLTRIVEKYGNVDSVRVDLVNEYFDMVEGSSLYSLHSPLVKLVEDFQVQSFVMARIESLGIESYTACAVTEDSRLLVVSEGDLLPALRLDSQQPDEQKQIALLTQCANRTGGFVWDSHEGCLAQWLKFYEFDVPTTVGGCKRLIEYLNIVIPTADPLGNYWGQIYAEDELSLVLTTEEKIRVKAVAATLMPGSARLLDKIYIEAGRPLVSGKANIARTIRSILAHEKVQSLASSLNQQLGWYRAGEDKSVTSQDLSQLMMTAVILDLDVPDANQRRNVVCGYDLYQVANADLHPDVILNYFENHLVSTRSVASETAAMAAYIMLAEQAPEFLVKNIGEEMTIGSVAWINFCATVATLELKAQGTARVMDAGAIQTLSGLEPCSQGLRELQSVALVDPILDWGLVNGIVTHETLAANAKETSELLLAQYEAHTNLLSVAANDLGRPLPDKQNIALKTLEKVLPNCDFLEERVLYEKNAVNFLGSTLDFTPDGLREDPHSSARSMAEVYASGELQPTRWDLRGGPGIFKQFGAPLYALPSIEPWVITQTTQWYARLKGALAITLRLAVSRMPPTDRRVFLNGDISVFTLRPSVAVSFTGTTSTSGGLTGVSSVLKTRLIETQATIDESTGRYGVVICAPRQNQELLCYELLTLRGECRRNDRLAGFASFAMNRSSRIEFDGDPQEKIAAAAVVTLPTDLRCYTEGRQYSENASSKGVIEKLGVVRKITRVSEFDGTAYQGFNDIQMKALVNFVIDHHPPATYKDVEAVALKPTSLEEMRQKTEKLNEYILNLVVPFRSCIADLASGDRDRVGSGVFGCVMDAIGLLGTAVGVASKIMGVMTKSVSTTAKVATLARFALTTTISLFNPLDGFYAMAKTGGKLLGRGGAQLGRSGVHALTSARFQLRRVIGRARSVDLLKANDYARLCQGTWQPLGSAQRLNVCATQQGTKWFATNRFGRPWGPSLENFAFSHALRPFKSRKMLPDVYTGHIIRQALPQAGAKIDSALGALVKSVDQLNTQLANGLLFGSTEKGRDNMLTFLKLIKTDFHGFSFGNCLLEAVQNDRHTMVIDSTTYVRWKETTGQQSSTHRFLKVYVENMQEHFHNEKSSTSVIAGDLIQQLSQVAPTTRSMALASRPKDRFGELYQLNVTPLLNLAQGKLPVASMTNVEGKPFAVWNGDSFKSSASEVQSGLYDKARAIENADTYAVMSLLLDQASGDQSWRFRRNVQTMQEAVTASNGERITGEVLLEFDR